MSASLRRFLAVAAAASTLGLLALAFMPSGSAPAPKPISLAQSMNVIVIPSPDQAAKTIDVCQWLKARTADGPTPASPLAAAEYAASGMSGVRAVARLYGC